MSILGVVARVMPAQLPIVVERLKSTPGVELGPNPGNGRLALVIESTAEHPAATIMGEIALWPEVMNTSLVYEYTFDDSANPAPALDYSAWRSSLKDFAQQQVASAKDQPPA